MKKNSWCVIGLWLLVVSAASGELRQSLDGPWQFTTNETAAVWDQLPVPGNWDTTTKYSTFKGTGFYRRQFSVPADWKGKHVRLRFEAVYHDATVTLNGQELGKHVGGYTPFEFDVTDKLKWAGANTVTVAADNTFRRGAWWHWGGISRSVHLIANDDVRLVWQHIRTEPDLKAGTAQVFVKYKLANAGPSAKTVTLTSRVEEKELSKSVEIPAKADVVVDLNTTLSNVRLWHFDHPNLYRLTTRVAGEEKTDRFGIRKVEVKPDGLYLNGERVRLCGFNRVSDSNTDGNTEPDELVKRDVDLMKRCGANLTRIMHYAQAPNLLDYLDEKGMLIWEEIPVWGHDDPNKVPDNPVTRQWMTEMIERDYNHPCIIGWSVGNEMLKHYDYAKSMMEFTRKLDPHRLVTHVSFSGARKDYNPTNDPISISDITLYNTYSYNSNAVPILRKKWPDKPIFLSEFGMKQFGGNLDARIAGLDEFYKNVTSHPYLIGVSLWTFNDYRSDYKGTPRSGNREWGVVTVDRQPKAAYEQVRKLYSPVHSLTIKDGVVRVEPRSPDEAPSYTLRGYKLKWDGGEMALPELKPGDPAWSKPIPATKVSLVTPTGYAIAESGSGEKKAELDLGSMIQPVPVTAKFADPDFNIWCGSAIKGDDGKYHIFYSRWPRKLGHLAWVTHSEVAHAVSDSPFGPWKHHDVALPARGTNFWDGSCTHNPTVLRIAGKYYLYYMGNYGDGVVQKPLNWTHRNHQRIGVAVADSPNGPWQRFDKPVVDVSADDNAPDALVVTNPSVAVRPDGGVLMIYKAVGKKRPAPFGGPVVHLAATADKPTGPFKKHDGEIFGAKGVMFAAEDPFIWHDGNRYWAVVKDNEGNFTHRGYSLALWESADGFDWKLSQHPFVANPGSIRWADGQEAKLNTLERPQVLLENGKPIALFCAAADKPGRDGSFNVQIPLKSEP